MALVSSVVSGGGPQAVVPPCTALLHSQPGGGRRAGHGPSQPQPTGGHKVGIGSGIREYITPSVGSGGWRFGSLRGPSIGGSWHNLINGKSIYQPCSPGPDLGPTPLTEATLRCWAALPLPVSLTLPVRLFSLSLSLPVLPT